MDTITMPEALGSANSQSQRVRVTVADQKVGDGGIIRQLSGDQHIVSRLLELGLVPGYQVKLKNRAPFGDPLIVEINGISVALRWKEAQCVQL